MKQSLPALVIVLASGLILGGSVPLVEVAHAAQEQQLLVIEPTEAYTPDDEIAWEAESSEVYNVLLVEGDWALAHWEHDPPEQAVWLKLDERVSLEGLASSPAPTEVPVEPAVSLRQRPDLLTFDVGLGVPSQDVEDVRTGIRAAQQLLDSHYGGDITSDWPVTIRMVADSSAPCCNAFIEGGTLGATFHVGHRDWTGAVWPTDHPGAAAHEYVHVWQQTLGCTKGTRRFPEWMNEGIAVYVAAQAILAPTSIGMDGQRFQSLATAINGGWVARGLASAEDFSMGWPGDIGFLAVDRLIQGSPFGERSLRFVCEAVAAGVSLDSAFEQYFNMSQADLYRDFDRYVAELKRAPIRLAYLGRVPPGSGPSASMSSARYWFQIVGYALEALSERDRGAAVKLPPGTCRWGSEHSLDVIYIEMCSQTSAGSYTLSVALPDGRSAAATFRHER